MATVQKRGNSYLLTVSAGYNAEGKQIRKTMTWRPEEPMTGRQADKEAERQAVLFEEKVRSGRAGSGNIRFADFAAQWFTDYAKDRLKPTTYARYVQLSERTYAAIGHIRLDKLHPQHLVAFYAQLAEPGQNKRTGGGMAPKTIKHYHTFISSVLDRAVKWGLIPDNPCRRLDAPRVPPREIQCMDDEQAVRFLECLEEEPLETRLMFTLLLMTGIRRGELLGLEWKDIDFDSGTIMIRRTSQYTPGRGIYTESTKTAGSVRKLCVAAEVVELLRAYRSEQNEYRLALGDRWQANDRLFTQWDGKPMSPNTPYLTLERLTKRHGLPGISIHSLRHTNATLMIQQGLNVKTVSSLLGHTQTSTTMNIYAHQLKNANRQAAEAMADTLLRKRNA